MLLMQLISIELIIGIAAIGAVSAWKKSLGERLCLLGTIPVSFALAFGLTKLGIWNFFGLIGEKLMGLTFLGSAPDSYVGTVKLTAAVINSFMAHLMLPVLFWIFLRVTAAIVRAILKHNKASERYRLFADSSSSKLRVGTCAIGAAHSFLILMLSLLPVVGLLSLPAAAVDRSEQPAYEGTYVSEVVGYVNQAYIKPVNDSILMKANKLCGANLVLKATSNSISQKNIKVNDDTIIKVNSNKLTGVLLADGVTGVALYEYWCDPAAHTIDQCTILADVLHDLSNEQILMQVGVELAGELVDVEGEDGQGDIGAMLLNTVKNSSAADMSVAFDSLGNAVEIIAAKGGSSTLESETMQSYLIEFMGNDENAIQLAQAIAPSGVCCSALQSVTELGLEVICVTFDISDNPEEYYNEFITALENAVKDNNTEADDISNAESFIKYTVDNGMKVADLAPNDQSTAESDKLYEAYQRYMSHKDSVYNVLNDYMITGSDKMTLFISADRTSVYVYDAAEDKWSRADAAQSITDGTAVVTHFLVCKANQTDGANIDTIRTWVWDGLEAYLGEISSHTTDSAMAKAKEIRLAIMSLEGFDVSTVFAEDILSTVNSVSFKDSLEKQDGVESFAKVLTATSTLLTDISSEDDEDMSKNMLMHFSDMGVIFDALCQFGSTEEVPENVLVALSTNRSYKKYFSQDAVNEIITNSNNGNTTYESMFTSVETLFVIINTVVE